MPARRSTATSIAWAARLAVICDILDPDVIVLGGGMSNVSELYEPPALPAIERLRLLRRVRDRGAPGARGDLLRGKVTAARPGCGRWHERTLPRLLLVGRGGSCRRCLGTAPVAAAWRAHPDLFALSIAHLDCDAFYASVEKRDRPELRDQPVIVGGGKRGVVTTCCYIARLFGVRSAMPMFQARKLCPEAVIVAPDFEKYRTESRRIMDKAWPGPLIAAGAAPVAGRGLDRPFRRPSACTARRRRRDPGPAAERDIEGRP